MNASTKTNGARPLVVVVNTKATYYRNGA